MNRASASARAGASAPSRQAQSGPRASGLMIGLLAASIVLPLASGALDFTTIGVKSDPLNTTYTNVMGANPVTRAIKIYMILIGLMVIFSKMNDARALLKSVNPFYLVFVTLAHLSIAWSYDPGASINRCISMDAVILVSFAFSIVGWHPQRLVNVLRPLFTVIVIGSLIYIAGWPDLAIDFDKAGYHGLAGQKNPFGWQGAACALLWMHALFTKQTKAWMGVIGILLGWAALILSRSSTSILATAFAGWLMWMLAGVPASLRRYTPYIITLFACLVVLYALAVLQIVPGLATILLGPIMAITGKDMTFSNRAQIWQIIKEHAAFHPTLGTGFGAYWTGMTPDSPSFVFIGRMYFWPSEAHNGYLDVYNDLGIVGLVVLLGFLIFFVRQALKVYKVDRAQGIFFLGIFFQQAVNNLSESLWFSPTGALPSLIVTMVTFSLGRSLIELRKPRVTQTPVQPPPVAPPPKPKPFTTLRSARGLR